MRLKSNPAVQLTYCLNVHPGAGLEDIHAAVGGPARELGGRVGGGGAFGLGLRVSGIGVWPAGIDVCPILRG